MGSDLSLLIKNKTTKEYLNSYPCNSGLVIYHTKTNTTISSFMPTHSMMCRFESNFTYDLLLTRSENNLDSKGLFYEELIDLDYA